MIPIHNWNRLIMDRESKQRSIVMGILSWVVLGVAIYCTVRWYDWKLILIIMLFLWSNNLRRGI